MDGTHTAEKRIPEITLKYAKDTDTWDILKK
jgi:hypothetical protein